ncbi:MAG: YicC/YloC family endoribonuclease [Bacillota bacterium]|nr:YicC/YloC family endoribonuclease [Bacillota bacterium]NLJ02046.1 YicC family protein [Bacillota bacterium]
MIKSMTGFGQGEAADAGYAVQVEIKSVNHRYLDLFFRIPKQYSQLEETLRTVITGRLARGRVEVTLSVEEFGDQERIVQINNALLKGYLQALRTIQSELGSEDKIQLSDILVLPGLLEVDEPPLDWDNLQQLVAQAANAALDGLEAMREAEGRRLCADLEEKLLQVEKLRADVAGIAPQVVVDYRKRLRERLGELLDGTTLTEERFLGEVAIFADRCSIDEELVRLASHIQEFKETLKSHASVGRKLDFLIQEMNREVNTIGSKANNVHIAASVVSMKSELEKIREQVQNIE